MMRTLLAFLITLICAHAEQDESINQSFAFAADTAINNGWLILHGRLLEKPYHFHLENDTFWINDIQYLPPPPNPLEEQPKRTAEWTELGKWYLKTSEMLIDSCQAKYRQWLQRLDTKMALDSLFYYVNNQKMIKIKPVSGGSSGIKIVFEYRYIDLKNNLPKNSELAYKNPKIVVMLPAKGDLDKVTAPKTQGEIFLDHYNRLKNSLTCGRFLFLYYGSSYHELGDMGGREAEFINEIKEILAMSIPKNQMMKKLREQGLRDSLEAEYIIYNRGYWLDSLKIMEKD